MKEKNALQRVCEILNALESIKDEKEREIMYATLKTYMDGLNAGISISKQQVAS